MTEPLSPEELGELFQEIDNKSTGKLSELANIAGLSLAEDYIGADLSGEDLSKDNLRRANFEDGNLSDTNLSNSNLSEANLIGAIVINAQFSDNIDFPEALKEDLKRRGAIFIGDSGSGFQSGVLTPY